MKVKLAVVEDEIEFALELKNLLILSEDISEIKLYSSAEEFIEEYESDIFDVVMMDIGLPGINGIDCIRKLKPINPETQFIVFTIYDDNQTVFEALCAGATGYILKSSTQEQITNAIKEIHTGGSPMSSTISRMVMNYFSLLPKKVVCPKLTERETQILELLSEGKRYKEIANSLFISMDTVRTHIRNIYLKLEVSNKTQAINKYRS
jgi:DNA-binding NarL/FixJ family response regulator